MNYINLKQKLMLNVENRFFQFLDAEENLNQKIFLALWLVRFYVINFIQFYANDKIESYLGSLLLNNNIKFPIYTNPISNYLILATSVYKNGGHSRMIEATVDSFGECKNLTLTRIATSDYGVVRALQKKIELSLVDENLSPVDRIFTIYSNLILYRTIILYIHPDDIESAVAIWIDKKLNPSSRKYFFVNHADHVFSCAKGLSDVILEVSEYGWFLNDQFGLTSKQNFLGIPIFTSEKDLCHVKIKSKIIISGGAAYKFKKINNTSLESYIDFLLSNNKDFIFYLIGPSYSSAVWIAKLKLKFFDRFFCFKALHYLKYRELLKSASVYVDSYPVTGGTAFTEALLNGLNVVGISGGVSGYGYADILRVQTKEDLSSEIRCLMAYDSATIARQSSVRDQGLKFHSISAFAARFRGILLDNLQINVEPFSGEKINRGSSILLGSNRSYRCPSLDGLNFLVILKLLKFGIGSNFGLSFAFEFCVRVVVKRSRRNNPANK